MTEVGVILYGAPASGKDTVTAALHAHDPRFTLYQRLKVGPGRTTGYRLGSAADVARLEAAGHIIYRNDRYGATYIVDRLELARLRAAHRIPVVHLGQPEAVDALVTAATEIQWVTVELHCPRNVSAARIEARQTGDTEQRLAVWDGTPALPVAGLRIDTARTGPAQAAEQIAAAIDRASWSVIVPALNPVTPSGDLDLHAARRYAEKASRTWVDHILVNGSTTRGDLLTPAERAAVLDVWAQAVDPARLLACTWEPTDLDIAADRNVTPMALLHGLEDSRDVLGFLERLPAHSTIYSHPMYGSTFTAGIARAAARGGYLPAGGKLAKVAPGTIREIVSVAPDFAVWDGSARHVRESLAAGAAGIVATPLAALLGDGLPPKETHAVQVVLDRTQAELDRLPDRAARRKHLLQQLGEALATTGIERCASARLPHPHR